MGVTTLVVLIFCSLLVHINSQRVKTPLGEIIGTEEKSRTGVSFYSWRNIRYATAERFKSPVLVEKFPSDPFIAKGESPMCPQYELGVNRSLVVDIGDEDCLFMNIFSPANATSSRLPVVMYVHGGGFAFGKLFHDKYALYFLDNPIVLVAFQYRLGVFGFLSTGNTDIPGNFGLKDQKAALEWTTKYISFFGGDSSKITVFGESAGGASAHLLISMPTTKDMVYAGVSSSGTITNNWSIDRQAAAIKKGKNTLKSAGCPIENASACLSQLSAKQLLNLALQQYGPTIEVEHSEAIITTDPVNLISTKPWITSWTNGEHIPFTLLVSMFEELGSNQSVIKHIRASVESKLNVSKPDIKSSEVDLIINHYFPDEKGTMEQYGKFIEDFLFAIPALQALRRHQGPKYAYHMEYRGEIGVLDSPTQRMNYSLASHAEELYFWFYRRKNYSWAPAVANENDTFVSKTMIKTIVDLATFGSPTGAVDDWLPYTESDSNIMRIKADGSFETDHSIYNSYKDTLALWDQVLPDTSSASAACTSFIVAAFTTAILLYL